MKRSRYLAVDQRCRSPGGTRHHSGNHIAGCGGTLEAGPRAKGNLRRRASTTHHKGDDGGASHARYRRCGRRRRAQEPRGRGPRELTAGWVLGPQRQRSAPVRGVGSSLAEPCGVVSRFEGLNHFDSRYSGGGNAFSGEPPDQGMCVGGNYVFEIVNSVVQVYTKSGTPLIAGNKAFPDGPSVGLTLNEFYGLPPAFVRPDGPFGPYMFDTSCLYDPSTQRWFVTSANLDQDPVTGDFTGAGQVWLAVSTSSNPLGSWNIWSIDTTNNGQNGTPDHGCLDGYCFGDYPQIGLDAERLLHHHQRVRVLRRRLQRRAALRPVEGRPGRGQTSPTMQMFENVPTATYNDLSYTMQPVNALPDDWDSQTAARCTSGCRVRRSPTAWRTRSRCTACPTPRRWTPTPEPVAAETSVADAGVRDARVRPAAERADAAAVMRQRPRLHRGPLPEHQGAARAGRR